MNIFSFKTELDQDVDTFKAALKPVDPDAVVHTEEFRIGPDRGWCGEWGMEITTRLDLEQMREVIRHIPDGHVMLQTLLEVPLKQNPLERDFSAE